MQSCTSNCEGFSPKEKTEIGHCPGEGKDTCQDVVCDKGQTSFTAVFYPGEDKRLGQALQFDLFAKKNARDERFFFVWLPPSSLSCLISRAVQLLTHQIREGGGGGLLPLRASVGLKIRGGGGRASPLDPPRVFSPNREPSRRLI